ncbi:MAG TPA: hypothetical protein VL132_09395 [Planctomycetaceae bacterium]|nr:hypothetical protein [Planctomycetaceae bacterium]
MTQRLLIADRWRLVAEHLRMLFIERGFEIEVATDGLDCLAKIQSYGPDAILIDEDLPWGAALELPPGSATKCFVPSL